MRLTIDTETDTYEQAIAAVQAAYGLRPVTPADWPEAPAVAPHPDPQDLSGDDIGNGRSEQALFRMTASLMPGAHTVLRRITDLGGTTSFDEVQPYFANHPTTPIAPAKLGGTLTSIKAVQRRIAPTGASPLLQRRLYQIDRVLVEGLRRAFATARPDLLRGEPRSASPALRELPEVNRTMDDHRQAPDILSEGINADPASAVQPDLARRAHAPGVGERPAVTAGGTHLHDVLPGDHGGGARHPVSEPPLMNVEALL
ncbi:hypothetical protein, partial [Streptomyces sp. MK37H]|uniref:hypothetical protein n=1 Tax=Streptomyces sp. MK37H TaxID=2699117 RepID=UPI001FF7446C